MSYRFKVTLEEIKIALEKTDGAVSPAAKLLGITKQALQKRVNNNQTLKAYTKKHQKIRKKKRVNKRNAWLKYYLSEGTQSFLNKAESAKRAGYSYANEDCLRQTGCRLFAAHTDIIEKWFDEVGLSENALKTKLLSLLEAKETKFFTTPIKIIVTLDGKEAVVDDILIKQIDVESLEVQRKTLDMAIKVRGMYAEKRIAIIDVGEKAKEIREAVSAFDVTIGIKTKQGRQDEAA